ncbi:MAG TPA: hypothetical protein VE935_07420 [Burkholderiales bacterium]|nr:hypothetical protein [Burkholderiales bacterium]
MLVEELRQDSLPLDERLRSLCQHCRSSRQAPAGEHERLGILSSAAIA